MTCRLAIARKRGQPTIFTQDFPTLEVATQVMDRYWRDDYRSALVDGQIPGRFSPRANGDYCIIPARVAPDPTAVSSDAIRRAAIATIENRPWRQAFTAAELADYDARNAGFSDGQNSPQ